MIPREIDLDQSANALDVAQEAAAELEQGHLVLLPDECGWTLLGLACSPVAAELLSQCGQDSESCTRSLALAHPQVLADYAPGTSRLFRKLSIRCWPGPVILREDSVEGLGFSRRWSPLARSWGKTEQGQAYSCPADQFTADVLQMVSSPALSIVGRGNEQEYVTGGLREHVQLIVRTASSRFSEPPTVIRVNQDRFEIERPGVVSERMVMRLAGDVYLFVCTGNTCRSPMAEVMFRKMLAERLKCREDELLDRGFAVISAGLAAHRGAAASPEAVMLLRQLGFELGDHESQPVTEELLSHCDQVITMTRGHRDALLSAYPEFSNQVRLLSPHQQDVADPFGAGLEEYAKCQEEIASHLKVLLDEIDFSTR